MSRTAFISVGENGIPSLSPAWTLFFYVVGPLFMVYYNVKKTRRERRWNGGKMFAFMCNLAHYLYQNAPTFVLSQVTFMLILLINQGSYCYSNLKFGYDMAYYSQVNLGEYSRLGAMEYLASFNSLDALNGGNGASHLSRRLEAITDSRRLQISSIDSNLTIAYHLPGWDNLLTEETLQNICYSERNILNDPGCIGTGYYSSVIPQLFHANCEYKTSFDATAGIMGSVDNSLFVSDYIDQGLPQSSVLFTYFSIGDCKASDVSGFGDFLQSFAVNGTEITYTSKAFNKQALQDNAADALYFCVAAALVAYVVLVFGVRGLAVPIVTMICLIFSFINAAALMALTGYRYFSIGNSAGVLITLIYGCNSVNTFGSSWRQQVKKGCHPSIPNILNSYIIFGQRMFYVTTLAVICLFALLNSPVQMVSQFGVFTGFSVLSFYLVLHYVIIPFWLFTSWFTLNQSWHAYFKEIRGSMCYCCKVLNDLGMVDTLTAAMILGGDDDDSSSGSESASEQAPEEQSIVQPDRIVFVGEDPNRPAGEVSTEVIVNASILGQEPEEAPVDPAFEEVIFDMNLCRGKRPLKLVGFFVLLVVLVGLGVVYALTVQKFNLNTGIPRMFPPFSNLGMQMRIMEKHKHDLLNSHMSSAQLTGVVFNAPTRAPTQKPTGLTIAPSARPTTSPTIATPPASVNYVIKACWGVNPFREYLDSDPIGHFEYASFAPYVTQGLVSDMRNLCSYVANNRDYLSITPEWNITDCIYMQYQRAYNSLPTAIRTTVNGFTAWGQRTEATKYSIGYASSGNQTLPVWLCTNFTVQSAVTSLGADPAAIELVRQRWSDAFDSVSTNASLHGVNAFVTSDAFAYPLLSHEQEGFLKVSLSATIIGFVGLLYIFTLGDLGLTVFGTLTIVVILSVSVCLHIYFSAALMDLWDLVVIQAIMLIIVDFPVHLIEEYMAARAAVDRQGTMVIDKALSPALAMTNKKVRPAVLAPLFLAVLSSIPPMFAELAFLKRTGEYIITVSLVSALMVVFFQPYLLAFGCRTKFFEQLCYVEEEEGEYNMPAAAVANLPTEQQQYVDEEAPAEDAAYATAEVDQQQRYEEEDGSVMTGPGNQSFTAGSQSSSGYPPANRPYARHGSQMMYQQHQPQPNQSQLMHIPSEMEMVPQNYHPQFQPNASQYMIPQQDPMMYQPGPPAQRQMNRIPTMQGPPPGHGHQMPLGRHPSMMPTHHMQPPPRLHPSQSMYQPYLNAPPPHMMGGPPPQRFMGPPQGEMYPPPPQEMYPPQPHYNNMPSPNSMYNMPRGPPPQQYPHMHQQQQQQQPRGYPPHQRNQAASFYDAPQY